jgi:hypothetical protein
MKSDQGTQTNFDANIHAIKMLEAINDWLSSDMPQPTEVTMFRGSSSVSSSSEPQRPGLFFQFMSLFRSTPQAPEPVTFKDAETQTDNVYQKELERGKLIRGELSKYF